MSRLTRILNDVDRRLRGHLVRIAIQLRGGKCGRHLAVERGASFLHAYHPGIQIGESVLIGRDVCIEAPIGTRLCIGDGVKLTRFIIISVAQEMSLGPQTIVAEFVSLRDHDHGTVEGLPIHAQPLVAKAVRIGAGVWLARGVAVLKGCTIGDGAVIGANSVVTRDMPSQTICAGVPAKVIKPRTAAVP